MKIGMTVAAALLLAALLAGCADGGNNGAAGGTGGGIPSAPAVELPPSEGEDIFKGRTFGDGRRRYVFSDDGMMTTACDDEDEDKQYRYSANEAKGELYLKVEKIDVPGRAALLSFDECIAYYTDGGYLKEYEAYFKESSDNEITQEELAAAMAGVKKWLDEEVENGCPRTVRIFSVVKRFKYTYDGSRLRLEEQYEEDSAAFSQKNPENQAFDSIIVDFSELYAGIDMEGKEKGFYDRPYSFSEKGSIVFVNMTDDSKKIVATYTIADPGSSARLVLSFEYEGKECIETLDFKPDTLYLTEVGVAASSPRD